MPETWPNSSPSDATLQRPWAPDHPKTLAARNKLAGAYLLSGRAAEAIPLREQTLATLERLLGPDHRDTLSARKRLAVARQQAGRAQ